MLGGLTCDFAEVFEGFIFWVREGVSGRGFGGFWRVETKAVRELGLCAADAEPTSQKRDVGHPILRCELSDVGHPPRARDLCWL